MGPYEVLYCTEIKILILLGPLVELVNSDRVTHAPAPTYDKSAEPDGLPEATKLNMWNKDHDGPAWIVDGIVKHIVHKDVTTEFLIDFNGPCEATWEPKTNVPEELIVRYLIKAWKGDRDATTQRVHKGTQLGGT